jgi:hypothetical protein
MCPAYLRTSNSLVAAHNQVLYIHVHIRERCEQHPEVQDYAVPRWWDSRNFFVFDKVIGELLSETVNVASIDKVVKALN